MTVKKIYKFVRKNYILAIIFIVVLIVGIYAIFSFVSPKERYVYVKVKVGQGYWWGSNTKPGIWYINSIKKGATAGNILGRPYAKILSVRYYPQYAGNQYDAYVTLRLRAGYSKRTKQYSFNRGILTVSAPIEIQFPTVTLTGTILEISPKPINDKYVDKIVTLVNQGGYRKDLTWRYDNVNVGDKYFDGEDYVLEVISKELERAVWAVTNPYTGQVFETPIESEQNIIIKARMKLLEKNNGYHYNEEYKVQPNIFIPISTNNYFLENFTIRKVE